MTASQGTFPLVLSIPKFSYVTTTAGRTSPLSWTHISGGTDLKAVFDRVYLREDGSTWTSEKRTLRVLRGADVLEDLDLDALAREAMISSSSQMQISNAKAPIAVIVKSPCLAIRYPTRVNQIRRFQLKFASSADYCRAISILSEIGCPITESIVGTTCQTSVGSQTRPNTSAWSQDTSTPLRTSTSHIENQNGRAAPVLVSETRPSTMGSSSTLCTVPPSRINQMANLNRTFQTNLQKASLSERPSTAPVLEQESLSQLLPPKRDLPFARPRQRQQRYIVPKPNTESTVTNHTGIPEARPQTHTGETSLSQAFQSPATRPTLGVATTPASNNTAVGSPGLNFHSANLTESASVTSSNVSPMKRPLESAPGFSPVKMSKPLSAHSYSSNHHGTESLSNIAQTPIQQILPQTPQPPQHSYPNPPSIPNPSPTQHLRENNNPSNAPASEPPLPNPSITLTTADLSAYLSNPASERSALIESWVCQQLDSDAFLALCQDVEGVWKRVVFGM